MLPSNPDHPSPPATIFLLSLHSCHVYPNPESSLFGELGLHRERCWYRTCSFERISNTTSLPASTEVTSFPDMRRFVFHWAERPQKLWRVQYEGSWTRFEPGTGFIAADTETWIFSNHLLKESVVQHLRPQSCVPSPYVSTFSSKLSAEIWASKLPRTRCTIFEIQTANMENMIFGVAHLMDKLGIGGLRDPAECLVLHTIPTKAVVGWKVTEVRHAWRPREQTAK
jgi:hypothetical protein